MPATAQRKDISTAGRDYAVERKVEMVMNEVRILIELIGKAETILDAGHVAFVVVCWRRIHMA